MWNYIFNNFVIDKNGGKMKEAILTIKDMYLEFFGNGAYIILFLISLLYVFFVEKDKNDKIKMFFWNSIILVIIIFNPIIYKIFEPIFSGNVYWRMFWMLPIGILIPYVATKLISEREKMIEKIIITISIIVIIILSGKCVFNKDNFSIATNSYKIPQEALEVAKIISEDECDYKVALVPETIVAYIRQYDSNIILRYGRNPHTYDNEPMVWNLYSGNVEEIVKDAEKRINNYVVFRNETELIGNMEDYGYEIIGKTEKYTIYKR